MMKKKKRGNVSKLKISGLINDCNKSKNKSFKDGKKINLYFSFSFLFFLFFSCKKKTIFKKKKQKKKNC